MNRQAVDGKSRLIAAFVTVAAIGLASCSSAGGSDDATVNPPAASSAVPSTSGSSGTGSGGTGSGAASAPPTAVLSWKTCGGSDNKADQCSSLKVPLDPSAPSGTQVTLALIRRVATTKVAGQRIGSLLLNPGGPGGSTVDEFDGLADQLSVSLRTRFDILGFDPRGVGHSTPALVCANGAVADRLNADSPNAATAAGQALIVADAKTEVASCVTGSGLPLLARVGTADAARDMDAIRRAVGDAKLTYLGYSYGTYLGAQYAQEFPDNVRALVLDGAEDPGLADIAGTEVQAVGFESALKAFLAACQAQGSACAWQPGGDLLTAYRTLLAAITATPMSTGDDKRPLTFTLAQNGVAAALYSKQDWPYLQQALNNAQKGDGATLLAFSDSLTDRDASGHYDNLDAALVAVNCRDEYQPPGLQPVLDSFKRLQGSAPDFANFALSEYECAIWPVRPTTQTAFAVPSAPPILIIGATNDPATPLSEARGLTAEVTGSRLLVRTGEGHTSYDASSCVRAAADAYLLNPSVLPPVGKVCPSN